MQLAHALDHGLAALGVERDAEAGVLLGEPAERGRHLLLVGLGLGLDRDLDHRVGELDALEDHGVARIRQGFPGGGVLEPGQRHDVAGLGMSDLLARIRVHQQHAADPLALALDGIEDGLAAVQHAGIDPDKRQRPHEGVGHDLEGQGGERLVVAVAAGDLPVGTHRHAADRVGLVGGGEIVDHRIQQRLYALVLEGGTVEHRHEGAGHGARANTGFQGLGIGFGAVEIGLHRRVVLLDGDLDEGVPETPRVSLHVVRNLAFDELRAEGLVLPDDRFHADQIDHPGIARLGPDRQLQDQGPRPEPVLDHVDAAREIGPHPVHLVDEADARHPVLVGLAPHGLGLRLHPGDAVENGDGAVQHAQAALDLDGEVDMARGVDDVDPIVAPQAGGGGRRDGYAALLLLLHPVHGRGALMHLAQLVGPAGVVEHPFRGRRLAGIDMGHDADIAVAGNWRLARHDGSGRDGVATSGNGRRPCWPLPSCGCLPAS